ncbi:MAG TPA: cation diffusion facilitator family transporter [Longilinea sp.]|nr:cation diffusion facilitator family transporter [Longilinea sp.]
MTNLPNKPERLAHHHSEDGRDGEDHHAQEHSGGWLGRFLPGAHSHSHYAAALDPILATDRGIWVLKVSLIGLLCTALVQATIVISSGSVALLADTIHNFADALTAIPLWLAFALSRRARNRRYTYGYGRAEDLAGAVIVIVIFLSAIEVFYQSFEKIIHPAPVSHVGWVAAAAVVGFLGNEMVAIFRLRVGREINSAALVADGLHSQADGFSSLGVLVGAAGVWLGFPLADPIVGIGLGIAILWASASAAREMWLRLMDATDPQVTALIEHTAVAVPGVVAVPDVRLRWVGHRQHAELHITVDGQLPTTASHVVAENVRHKLFHALPALQEIMVHIDPVETQPGCEHLITAHHHL